MKDNKKFTFSKRTLSNLAVVCAGVLLYLGLSNFPAIAQGVGSVYSVLSPFVIGIALAYLVNMPANFLQRRLFCKFKRPRAWAVGTAYLLVLVCLVVLLGLILPQVVESVLTLVRNLPYYLRNLNDLLAWLGENFDLDAKTLDTLAVSYQDIISTVAGWFSSDLLGLTLRVGSGLVGALTAFISSVYMLISKEKLLRQVRRMLYALLPEKRANGVVRVSGLSNKVFSGFIGGKVVDSIIIGAICFVFMLVMDLFIIEMPFGALISIIIGVTNIIPFFGPFIGAVPSAMILLLVNPWSALWFVVFIIVLQQFDGNYLGPKILGDSTGLPALWVLISIVVGGGLFGFTGMLLGVPTAAVLYTLISDFVANRLANKGLVPEGTGAADLIRADKAEMRADAPPAPVDENLPPKKPPAGQ